MIRAISTQKLLTNEDNGFRLARQTAHQDQGFFGIQVWVEVTPGQWDWRWRFVGDDGTVEDTRTGAGAGERFVKGENGTVLALRGNHAYVFSVQ